LLAERGMLAAYAHPTLGEVRAVGVPLRVAGYTPNYGPSPELAADTDVLLSELGFDEDAIAALREAGAFGTP
jgi:crotonobetainyl-CoA:carnitine CoA-transferase CaiB-like acyl-CoA transferase